MSQLQASYWTGCAPVHVAIYVAISVPNRAGTCPSMPLGLEHTCCFTRKRGAPGGIRTPDHLIRSPLPVGTLPKGRFVRGTAIARTPFWSIPG
jgi:hypothetical protein